MFHIRADVYVDISNCDMYRSKNWRIFGRLKPTASAMLVACGRRIAKSCHRRFDRKKKFHTQLLGEA